ncbi:hypothetical protein B7494_g7238 [Chlorociboria aeruginascens]|nr:hypothetical protein B7494_g7238 [Chlorociboria aeruginascens]
MFPSSNSTNQDSGLEDRLRGLILNNHPDANTNPASAQSVNLPPHMLSATPAQQQEYLTKANARSDLETASSGQATIPGRKRLNQAQRRQMNSPISIPIDPRVNQSPQTGREFTRHQQPSWPPQHNGYQTPNNQRYQQQQQQISPQFQNSSAQPYVQHPFQHPRQYPGHQHQSRPDGRLFYGTPGQVRNTYQSAENVAGQSPGYGARPSPQNRQLYQPGPYGDQNRGPPSNHNLNDISTQGSYLEALVEDVIPTVGICEAEIIEKENFRAVVEKGVP